MGRYRTRRTLEVLLVDKDNDVKDALEAHYRKFIRKRYIHGNTGEVISRAVSAHHAQKKIQKGYCPRVIVFSQDSCEESSLAAFRQWLNENKSYVLIAFEVVRSSAAS